MNAMPDAARRNRMKAHACRRARERWGARLTFEDIGALNAIIRMGLGRSIKAKPRSKGRNGRKFFVTTLDGMYTRRL